MPELLFVRQLLDLAKEFGPDAVLFGLLVALLLPRCRRIISQLDRLVDHKPDLKKSTETSMVINQALDAIIAGHDADRVYLCQYHNGGQNLAGVPFAKVSRTNERVRPGIPQQLPCWQKIPVGMFAFINSQLIERRRLYLPVIEHIQAADPGIYQSWCDAGVQSVYIVGLVDLDKNLIGFIAVEFCRAKCQLTEEDLDSIQATALKICGAIMAEK
jgi:hypothetical protein